MKKNPNEEPKLWVIVLKLVLGLVVIIGGVGLVLDWALHREQLDTQGGVVTDHSWGVVTDNPVRPRR